MKADYDHAIADYDEAIKLNSKNAAAFSARAIAWRLKGDGEKALADLSEAVRLDKKTAAALNARGAFYQSKADFEHALTDFSDAIKRDPKAPQSYSNRGLAHHAKGDLDHAIADFDEAIKRDPNYAAAYLNRANAWRAKKDFDRAKQDYEAALKLKPDLASAKKGLDEVEKLIAKKAATAAPAPAAPARKPLSRAHGGVGAKKTSNAPSRDGRSPGRGQSSSRQPRRARIVCHKACAAASTASAWPGTLTFRQIFAIRPSAPTRKVERSTPMYLRPYMLFSTHTP